MSTGVKTHRITDPNDDTRFVDVDPYVVEGVPRHRAVFDDSGFEASFNTSSLTNNATGVNDVNFSASFANINYSVTSAGESTDRIVGHDRASRSAGDYRTKVINRNGTDIDEHVDVIVAGDLA
jgi:hypothetical protein